MTTVRSRGWIPAMGEPGGWSPEDIESALKVEPLTGAEIVKAGLLGGWEDQGIVDSDAWLRKQRRRRRERRSW